MKLAASVRRALSQPANDERFVFACIGTDRSTGDALGPLVGERLLSLGFAAADVMGTLEDPLHALNLERRVGELSLKRPGARVVAVDAALGHPDDVGGLAVRSGGIRPGLGVGRDLPTVGDVSVTATVNVADQALGAQVLQGTRLFLVQSLAHTIALGLWIATRQQDDAPRGIAA